MPFGSFISIDFESVTPLRMCQPLKCLRHRLRTMAPVSAHHRMPFGSFISDLPSAMRRPGPPAHR